MVKPECNFRVDSAEIAYLVHVNAGPIVEEKVANLSSSIRGSNLMRIRECLCEDFVNLTSASQMPIYCAHYTHTILMIHFLAPWKLESASKTVWGQGGRGIWRHEAGRDSNGGAETSKRLEE